MNTTTSQALFRNNSWIGDEFARTGRVVNGPSKGFRPKPKSQQTIQRERAELKMNSRKNQCPRCFIAKPVNGECC